jgi:hypothetical protein
MPSSLLVLSMKILITFIAWPLSAASQLGAGV